MLSSVCVCVCVLCVCKCRATLEGRLQLAEQRLARERHDCQGDKARAEQRILSHVAHTRVRTCLTTVPQTGYSFQDFERGGVNQPLGYPRLPSLPSPPLL